MKKFFAFILLVSAVSGQTIQGRLTTSFYNWQRAFSDGSTTTHLRAYQGILLDATRNKISLHAYLQASDDLFQPVVQDPILRIHNLYVTWKQIGNRVDANIGRQPIIGGVGYGTMDGIYLKSALHKYVSAKLYGGAIVSPDNRAEFFEKLSDNNVFGGQLITTIVPDTRIGAGFFSQKLLPEAYTAIRVDSTYGNPYLRQFKPDEFSEQIFTADANYFAGKWDLYGRYDYDLLREQTQRMEFSSRYQWNERLGLMADYFSREPRIPNNSIFSVFETGTTTEYEVGANYNVNQYWRGNLTAAFTDYGTDDAQRGTLGISYRRYSMNYTKQAGFAGKLDGVSFSTFRTWMANRVMASILVNYASYSIGSEPSRHDTYSLALGGNYRWGGSFSFDGQVQWLKNQFYDNDVRLFFRGNYWFFQSVDWLKGGDKK